MTRDEAQSVIIALARAVLAHVPAREWAPTARGVALELIRLSGERPSESGSFKLYDPEAQRDTLRPPAPKEEKP